MTLEKIIANGIEKDQASRIYAGLMSYRGIRDSFFDYTDTFLKELLSDSHDSQQLYMPLDIVELKPFLLTGKVYGSFLLFDIRFIKRQYKAYPVYVELQIPKEKILGKGAYYIEDNDLLPYCKSFLINSEKEQENVYKKSINIIKELSDYETHTLIDIPIERRKQASGFFNLKKYRINIDDIHRDGKGEVVWAKDVRDALEKVVKKYPEAEKIMTMYYKNSPFINKPGFTIKKESSLEKKAQAVDLPLRTTENQSKILDFIKQGLDLYGNDLNGWVVGGYVRDSLMGNVSDDLDVAISSSASGLQFANFLKQIGSKMNPDPTGKVYSTALDKTSTGSGDLQVAALDIYGEKIDFVNLRTEEYSSESRVPVQTTTDNPLEDAQRRDLTINSLYYNIKTGKIEDYIGGLNDFQKMPDGNFKPKVLRTPADPVKTFIDDPLRMLRVLRFYSRYEDVQIDPSVIEAFKDQNVLETYNKLAPERSAKEIRKMMEGPNAVESSRVLLETGLYKKVFHVDDSWHGINIDQQSPYHQFNLMDHTLAVMKNYNEIAKRKGVEGEERGLMLLATLLHDFGKMHPEIRKQKMDRKTNEPVRFDRNGEQVDRYSYEMHENASADFTQNIMTQMGFSPEEKKFVTTVVAKHMLPHNFDESMKEKTMGKFLNQVGDLYEHIMDHGEADALAKGNIPEEERQSIIQQRQNNLQNLINYRSKMQNLVSKPILNGNEIGEIVNQVTPELSAHKALVQVKGNKPVFYMKLIIDKLLEQQWSGNVMDKLQAENFVKSQAKQILNLWKQQKKQAALDSVIKIAWGSGEESHGIFMEGDHPAAEKDYQRLNRSVKIPYNVGEMVRKRNRGYNFSQEQGRVEKIHNNIMTVKWNGGKSTQYSLLDSSKIMTELEKVF